MKMLGIAAMIGLTALSSPQAGGDDQEPERLGVKLSEWARRLDSPDVGVRNNAASALIGFGEAGAPATPVLAKLLREDRNADVRRHAAVALGEIGRKAKKAATALAEAAKSDTDPSVRVWSARGLARVDPARTEEAVERLIKMVGTGNAGFDRANAIQGLGEIGAEAKRALTALKAAAEDDDPQVAKAAREALRRIDPDR
jgi:HEAT repeat protein